MKSTLEFLRCFASPGSKPVLSDFSMKVKPGTMVAVTGETGVGKTTLLRLLLALVRPDSGSITIEDASGAVEVSERTRIFVGTRGHHSPPVTCCQAYRLA